MKKFKYEVTTHKAEELDSLVYYCNEKGECELKDIVLDEVQFLETKLNERGREGWELVQTFIGKDGFVVIWKKEI
ncbi:MAG TPA: hypothetical protein PLN69_07465 [bacterium]|nr:hypothetical protein [bacterium]